MLPPCRAEVDHWLPIASTRGRREIRHYERSVTVQHLVKRYGNLLVVNDVSFSIREGEIFGIIGPNGAGKTTSGERISGLHACGVDEALSEAISEMLA
jgi:ABC-type Mn2+/Zn2+ transport system ATPase subunit